MSNNDNKFGLIIAAISIFAIIIVLNYWLQKNVREIATPPTPQTITPPPILTKITPKTTTSPRKHGQKILRKDRISPGRDFMTSTFYQDDQEIAWQRIINETVTESTGLVPQGKIEFTNETKETYGTEYYRDGEKDGPSLTYLSNGQLNIEAYYQGGKLLRKKEYYTEGFPLQEANYENARINPTSKESGDGKIYYKDGAVKYEWHFTTKDKTGYQKSYNPDGTLRAAFYFDENGQLP